MILILIPIAFTLTVLLGILVGLQLKKGTTTMSLPHQTYIPFSDVWGAKVTQVYRPDGEWYIAQLICEGREEHVREGLDRWDMEELVKHWHDVIMLSNYESEVMN